MRKTILIGLVGLLLFSTIVSGEFGYNVEVSGGRFLSGNGTYLMQNISYALEFNNITKYNISTGEEFSIDNCTFIFNDSSTDWDITFNDLSTTHTFLGDGNVSMSGDCWFNDSQISNINYSFNITPYEPQLEVLNDSDNPFSGLVSASGFKLGNYDFNLDYVDDLIILEDNGLLIYDGNDLASPAWNSSEHGYNFNTGYEFFITDFDWDGDGDILIGDVTSSGKIYLLEFESFNTFTKVWNDTFTNLRSFGSFEANDDFYKDIIVLNGSGGSWDYKIIDGEDTSEIIYSSFTIPSGQCQNYLFFDFDKDNLQEIVCSDNSYSGNDQIIIFDRSNHTYDISQMDYYNFSLGYDVGSNPIFFSDVDSDGEWEIGIVHNNISYYKINISGGNNLNPQFTNDISYTLLGKSNFDLMNGNENNQLVSYRISGPNAPLEINNSINLKTITSHTFDSGILHRKNSEKNNSDIIVTTAVSPTEYYVKYYKNNIDLYRDTDMTHESTIEMNDKNGKISFLVNPSAEWDYNNYFLHFVIGNKTFRNDYFDSQQNLKYYMVDETNEYEFNLSSDSNYNAKVALNKYSMILTDTVTATNQYKIKPKCYGKVTENGRCKIRFKDAPSTNKVKPKFRISQ